MTSGLIVALLALVILILLAKELRQEILRGSVADGTTSSNAAAEFRNDSSSVIHIRKITFTGLYVTAGADEDGLVEISKSPTIASLTNNNVFFTWPMNITGGATGATDTGATQHGAISFGKGQLTLEPNESLFVNVSKDSGGVLDYTYVIHYEFS